MADEAAYPAVLAAQDRARTADPARAWKLSLGMRFGLWRSRRIRRRVASWLHRGACRLCAITYRWGHATGEGSKTHLAGNSLLFTKGRYVVRDLSAVSHWHLELNAMCQRLEFSSDKGCCYYRPREPFKLTFSSPGWGRMDVRWLPERRRGKAMSTSGDRSCQ